MFVVVLTAKIALPQALAPLLWAVRFLKCDVGILTAHRIRGRLGHSGVLPLALALASKPFEPLTFGVLYSSDFISEINTSRLTF